MRENALKVFFVCGAPKSGTTWLQRLLDAHPEVVCSGEGHFVERLALPMLQVRDTYNKHMSLVAERVYEHKPYYEPVSAEDMLVPVRNLILRQMQKRQKPGALAVGDKTPRYTDYLNELRSLFPRASFIHIVRDPRDVAVSVLHHGRRAGIAEALDSQSDRHRAAVRGAAVAWMNAQGKVAAFRARNPSVPFHELRYEDLLDRPLETARAAFRFLGARDSDAVVQAAIDATSFEALSGRQRGEESETSFFRKGIAGDWKGVLDDAALGTIGGVAGEMMALKGYNT
jgi:hypothetical protein